VSFNENSRVFWQPLAMALSIRLGRASVFTRKMPDDLAGKRDPKDQFGTCEAHPGLSGALFMLLRGWECSSDGVPSPAMTEKSGNGARIKVPKILSLK